MTKYRLFVKFIFSIMLFLSSCSEDKRHVEGAVLQRGQSIQATNKFGTIRVSYVSPTKRRYEWEGGAKVVNLRIRPEPFDGMTGLYDPADSMGLDPFEVRIVTDESQMEFENYEQVYAFLYQGSAVMDWVYTRDGLVVGFGRQPARQQLNVDIFQLLIHGKKPDNLKGAREQNVRLISK